MNIFCCFLGFFFTFFSLVGGAGVGRGMGRGMGDEEYMGLYSEQ